jgi:hypothetical protein
MMMVKPQPNPNHTSQSVHPEIVDLRDQFKTVQMQLQIEKAAREERDHKIALLEAKQKKLEKQAKKEDDSCVIA